METQKFELVLNEKYINPYKEDLTSYSLSVISKPKQQFGIKKIRGFKRVVKLGWNYTVKILK